MGYCNAFGGEAYLKRKCDEMLSAVFACWRLLRFPQLCPPQASKAVRLAPAESLPDQGLEEVGLGSCTCSLFGGLFSPAVITFDVEVAVYTACIRVYTHVYTHVYTATYVYTCV